MVSLILLLWMSKVKSVMEEGTDFVDLAILRNKTVRITKNGLITAKHCGTQRKLNLTLNDGVDEIRGLFFYITHGLAGMVGIQEDNGTQHVLAVVHNIATDKV